MAEAEQEPYNAGDPESVAKARSSAKLRDQRSKNQTKFIMSTPEGRAWMWELLGSCGVFQTPFALDTNVMAFACGRQDVGLRLLAGVNAECPELFLQMQREMSDV